MKLVRLGPVKDVLRTLVWIVVFVHASVEFANANPYLPKPGEPVARVRVGTCAVTGGFMHLYTALDNRIFDKYGIATEHVVLRGGAVAMAALASDEIQFLYCNAISMSSGSRPARTASSWLRFSWDFLMCCWLEGT